MAHLDKLIDDDEEFGGTASPTVSRASGRTKLCLTCTWPIGEWAQQAADKEGATVHDADLDLYSGVGGVAGLFEIATIVILLAPGHACQSTYWKSTATLTRLCLLMSGWVDILDLLAHRNKASSVSKLLIATLQGLQLAPLSVKEDALHLACAVSVKQQYASTPSCTWCGIRRGDTYAASIAVQLLISCICYLCRQESL